MTFERELESTGPEETARFGRNLAGLLRAGDTLLLSGELGAGKTALTKAIGVGLGVTEEVSSPTFTLVNEYAGRLPVFHLDLYRLDDPAEAIDLGFNDYLVAGGVMIVEWADKAPELWPEEYVLIAIERTGDTHRRIRVAAVGSGVAERLRALDGVEARDD